MNHEEKDALIADLRKLLEDKDILLVTANGEIVVLQGKITELSNEIVSLNDIIEQQKLALKTAGDELKSALEDNKSTLVETLTAERDNALVMITQLSAQVADQASVKTETEILVTVDGEKYLYAKRTLHTLKGEVKPEDAAKDVEFLRELIKKGSGAIRKADK